MYLMSLLVNRDDKPHIISVEPSWDNKGMGVGL